jgi:hypothetical protein
MMDQRTTEDVRASQIMNVEVIYARHDRMWRVVADWRNRDRRPDGVILWEPNLMRLPTENNEAAANAALARLIDRNPGLVRRMVERIDGVLIRIRLDGRELVITTTEAINLAEALMADPEIARLAPVQARLRERTDG